MFEENFISPLLAYIFASVLVFITSLIIMLRVLPRTRGFAISALFFGCLGEVAVIFVREMFFFIGFQEGKDMFFRPFSVGFSAALIAFGLLYFSLLKKGP